MNGQEIEIKLFVRDLDVVENRLKAIGAELEQPRTHEINLRFDTAESELSKAGKALRLRSDTKARMTYKGPSVNRGGARERQEIEFVVDDFHSAKAFLEALGFRIKLIYEKYRAEFIYQGVRVTLDELPYGKFVEIEGPDPASIYELCDELKLNWENKISESYVMLFNRLQRQEGYQVRDLIFENFSDEVIAERDLGLRPADATG
jgi:adenylate cyclase class 2